MAVNSVIISGIVTGLSIVNNTMALLTVKTEVEGSFTFLNVTLTGPIAVRAKSLKKDDSIVIEGRLESYKNKKGEETWSISQIVSFEKGDKGFMNKATIQGRLAADPKILKNGCGMKMTVANSRYYKTKNGEFVEVTAFIPVVMWNCADFDGKKGDPVWVSGCAQTSVYDSENGKRYSIQIVASEIKAIGHGNQKAVNASSLSNMAPKSYTQNQHSKTISADRFTTDDTSATFFEDKGNAHAENADNADNMITGNSFNISFADKVQDCPLPY